MTSETTTSQTPAATLTERELFAEFRESSFVEYDRLGRRIYSRNVSDLLEPEGCYDYVEVDLQLRGDDDDPSYTLEMIEADLSDILEGVRLARAAFDKLKGERLIMPVEPADDNDSEAYRAWERAATEAEENPRYRAVETAGEVQEAAFIEGGPFPDQPPAFVEMTPADEALIRGEVA